MINVDYKIYHLPFEYPFSISKGTKTHQPTMIVYLGLGAQYGLGEATEISYYEMTIDRLQADMEQHMPAIRRYAYNGPERFYHYLHHLIPDNNFLISALDCASWDLHAKLQGKRVATSMNVLGQHTVPTDYTLGISSMDELSAKVHNHPYPIYKVKCAKGQDTKAIEWLLSNTNATIRIDANEAWDRDTVSAYLPLLEHTRIDLLEQPFDRNDKEDLEWIRSMTDIPIMADEAIKDMNDMRREMDNYDGIVIKLSKCGGLTPALSMIEYAKGQGKKIMLGSMSESSIGAAAIAQLLPLADYADIDGPILLADNPAKGFSVDSEGIIHLAHPYGIGVSY